MKPFAFVTTMVILSTIVLASGCTTPANPAGKPGVFPVVAAENFWGNLIAQLGGSHVSVTSVVSDPNADPHEYESNTSNAILIQQARYVIVNGLGYDGWASHLLSSSNPPHRTVMNVQQVLGLPDGTNPHVWYSETYVNKTIAHMYGDLLSIDPANASDYQSNYAKLNDSLKSYRDRINTIRHQFAGVKVASTESIFVYMANETGLNLVSPPEFMKAVAEGTDPPANTVVTFQDQLKHGNLTVLVYNKQTVTPLTQQMKILADQNNVTVVGVTETIQPPDVTFGEWMSAELLDLQNGLNAKALGQ